MTYIKPLSLLAAAAFIGGALTAYADKASDQFAAMDVNGDSAVSEAEFVTYATADGTHSAEDAQARFVEIAGDDSLLTLEEFQAAYPAKAERPNQDHDQDQDHGGVGS